MSDLAFSILLSLVSAVAYGGGAIIQEQVAMSDPDTPYAPVHRPIWWASVLLNGLGALLHVGALAFGPLSLVQPLGALTIVFALPMAALLVGRRAGSAAWRGAVLASVGLAGLLALTGSAGEHTLGGTQRWAVALATGVLVLGLLAAARAAQGHRGVRSVLLATAAGLAFGIASVFTKTVAEDWSGGSPAVLLPSLGAIAALAPAGLLLSQASYRGAGLTAPLATVTVVNPVVAAALGITLFGESFRYGWEGTGGALLCGAVAAAGLTLLTREQGDLAAPGSQQRDGSSAAGGGRDGAPGEGRTAPGGVVGAGDGLGAPRRFGRLRRADRSAAGDPRADRARRQPGRRAPRRRGRRAAGRGAEDLPEQGRRRDQMLTPPARR